MNMKIRSLKETDAPLLADYYARNADRLAQFEPRKSTDSVSLEACTERLPQMLRDHKNRHRLDFVMESDDRIVGKCSLHNVIYEPYYSAVIGASIDRDFEGKGIMSNAMIYTITHAFDKMKLHRIWGYQSVKNERAGRMNERLGFKREGVAERLLFINGEWVDHYILSIINYGFELPK